MAKLKKVNEDLQDKDPILSEDQLRQRREEITKFYKDNIPHLTVQAEYEELLATIDKARAERLQAQIFMAQATAQQNPSEEISKEEKEFKEAMEKAAAKVE